MTEERKKNVNFTDTYTTSKQVIIVKDDTVSAEKAGLSEKFYDNFVKDSRYVYLLKGLGNTLLITVLALLVGVVFGFLIAIVRTNHDRNGGLTILNALCKLYLTIVRGTPVMIQLLIIYYVIFQSIDTGKVVVAVIAFGLNSAAYVAEIVRSGIMAVDMDLTKGGDIIRSVTYEAFMPLIAVALIYLIMVMGLSKVVNLLERKLRSNER